MAGGPMYVLERGHEAPAGSAIVFAALTAVAAFGIGNMVQANSISTLVQRDLRHLALDHRRGHDGRSPRVVILGGIKSIAAVCERLVPFMAIFYVARLRRSCWSMNCATIPAHHRPDRAVARSPARRRSAASSAPAMREAMRYGIARGLFSNESGLGSAPIVAAAAQTKNPVRQALVSSTGTFWDTVVVCAMTGLVVVNSGEWMKGLNGAALTKAAFADIPVVGPDRADRRPADLRLLDDPRLVVLRREGGRVPLRHARRSRPTAGSGWSR